MSTIEKAAAKLAQKKSKAKAKAGDGNAAGGTGGNAGLISSSQPTPPAAANPSVHLPGAAPVRSAVGVSARDAHSFAQLLPQQPQNQLDLDFDDLANKGFLTPNNARSALAQEFRKVKRQVLNRIDRLETGVESSGPTSEQPVELRSAPFNTFMVSSALAGEGKTFVSINLALSLAAEVDREVLLVDGDTAKADVSRNLGLQDRIGLGQVLQKPELLGEAIFSTSVPRLSVIPAGEYVDNLDELLASDLMEDLVQALGEQNRERVILFDAPPLLVTTEAAVLSRHLRQVLLVVEANRTPKDAVTQAVHELGDHRNVMMMLNKASGGGRFGYGYGYGYGQGDSMSDTQDVAALPDRKAD
ncbi:MAG: AAA family ATPase [Pseudomonadota bacterium]